MEQNATVGLATNLMNSASFGAIMDVSGRINVNSMRPFVSNKDGQTYVLVVRQNQKPVKVRVNAPATLQYDEWKDIDRAVIEVARQREVGIADLRTRGLTHSLGSIGQTISLWDRMSDMTEADVSMSAATEGERDTVAFNPQFVPVPIVHKSFQVELRRLEASRMFGSSIDVSASEISARLVSEKSETLLFQGASGIQVDGATVYGYTTHPDRTQLQLSTNWDDPATATEIFDDVQAMLQAARNDRHYGPYMLYIPGAYESVLDEDYVVGTAAQGYTSVSRTIRERLLALRGLEDIQVADFLPANNVVLVSLSRDVVDLAIAQDTTTVQWSTNGGMVEEFKVMNVMVPRIKSDYDGRSGIVHLRPGAV